jgi:hypothetical protein
MNSAGFFLACIFAVNPASSLAQDDDSAPLSGPKVTQAATTHASAPASILHYDLSGSIIPVEGTPERAAANALTLTEEEKRAVDAIFAKRASAIQDLIRDDLELLVRLNSGVEGSPEKLAALRELITTFGSSAFDRTLQIQVARALSEQNKVAFNTMVDEYMEALIAEAAKSAAPGTPKQRLETQERLKIAGQEVRAAFTSRIRAGSQKLERALSQADLDEATAGLIRTRVQQFYQETKGKPSKSQLFAFVRDVGTEIPRDKRRAFFKALRDDVEAE